MISRKITYTPLPKLLDILTLPFNNTPTTDSLSAVWMKEGDVGKWFSRSAWSLYVIAFWRKQVFGKLNITIWIPNFFCNESLTPLREIGVDFVFYPVDLHSYPAFDQLHLLANKKEPDIFLLVHYFGEPVNCKEAVAFCKEKDAWLIEDAAHVLAPIPGVGEAGDCVLYSPHKHLAIPDGAIMVVRQDGPSRLGQQAQSMRILDKVSNEILRESKSLYQNIAFWLIKRVLQKLGIRPAQKPPEFGFNAESIAPIFETPRMSVVAKRLLYRELNRLTELKENRIQRAKKWASVFSTIYPASVCKSVPCGSIPYLACFATPDRATAEFLYNTLHVVGLPVSTWPDLPPEFSDLTELNKAAQELRYTRIYLPVHENVSLQMIASYGKKIRKEFNRNWQLREVDSNLEWQSLWINSQRKSLTQTWEYGSAKEHAEGWKAQRYVVYDQNSVPIALFQVLVRKIFGFSVAARVNRGPIMLNKTDDSYIPLALSAIDIVVRKSRFHDWIFIQIAPFLPPSEEVQASLVSMGLKKQPDFPMDSALLSLNTSEDELIMGFNGKWRNCLRKGQKLGVIINFDSGGHKYFHSLIDFYKIQQAEKKFSGTSEAMLKALVDSQSESFKFNLFVARQDGDMIGVLVTLQFGDFSEYLIGISNEKGRANQANSVLLWAAIIEARRNGCKFFDLGGLAKNTPKGIADFKKGLNPEMYELVGEWRRLF
jgi:lipid II:glycine glycyltransferase (peptidoglycan interpeptide bridge formation enzyme)/dTDP-4-amino-4,6-dideoxygalactose transaminase